jgi:hypothetical protein
LAIRIGSASGRREYRRQPAKYQPNPLTALQARKGSKTGVTHEYRKCRNFLSAAVRGFT